MQAWRCNSAGEALTSEWQKLPKTLEAHKLPKKSTARMRHCDPHRGDPLRMRSEKLKSRKEKRILRRAKSGSERNLTCRPLGQTKTTSNKLDAASAHAQALRYTSVTPSRSGSITFSTRSSARIASLTDLMPAPFSESSPPASSSPLYIELSTTSMPPTLSKPPSINSH